MAKTGSRSIVSLGGARTDGGGDKVRDFCVVEQTAEGHDVVVGLIDPAWAYEMTYAESNGALVVAKVSLYPVDAQLLMRQMHYAKKVAELFGRDEDAARCAAALADLAHQPQATLSDVLPAGGLTSRHLRKVPFRRLPAATDLAKARAAARRLAHHYGIGEPPRGQRYPRPGRGRPARPIERLAVVAYCYSEACVSSRAPIQEVSVRLRMKPAKVRDDVIAARRKGLLTGTRKQGAPGGQLTEKCIEILRTLKTQRQRSDAGENEGRGRGPKRQNTAE
jgi:hypothetical protein